ncbi:origin recognition complex subunit Orc4 [Schizosaccharomyces japonicus yFS275]|uniref:Origin recognition complex subunit Orc4 n=1 Tax=Schizosaccharomyces japonicus (strain yFS275 / FY16936) TaxID=402676 RepID=B6K2C6_SCHJY|nr:origin recognition complex subunit Orc4 [Schizosaccharomyces japonicus yFS275]EEB07307.1 origin recognition complex subunit Orc4 [Schizosaccharomyces japonicus yFS275]
MDQTDSSIPPVSSVNEIGNPNVDDHMNGLENTANALLPVSEFSAKAYFTSTSNSTSLQATDEVSLPTGESLPNICIPVTRDTNEISSESSRPQTFQSAQEQSDSSYAINNTKKDSTFASHDSQSSASTLAAAVPSQNDASNSSTAATATDTAAAVPAVPQKRGRGRPRKHPLPTVVVNTESTQGAQPKRKRGRPRKYPLVQIEKTRIVTLSANTQTESESSTTSADNKTNSTTDAPVKRRRGRPRKYPVEQEAPPKVTRPRGRPRKQTTEDSSEGPATPTSHRRRGRPPKQLSPLRTTSLSPEKQQNLSLDLSPRSPTSHLQPSTELGFDASPTRSRLTQSPSLSVSYPYLPRDLTASLPLPPASPSLFASLEPGSPDIQNKITASSSSSSSSRRLRFEVSIPSSPKRTKTDEPSTPTNAASSAISSPVKQMAEPVGFTGDALNANEGMEVADEDLAQAQEIIMARLTGRTHIPLQNHTSQYQRLYQWLHQTVTLGEGNSAIIVGPRGSGKRTMVDDALKELRQSRKELFYTITLNGLYQTDDKTALREISRQLSVELDASFGDDESSSAVEMTESSFADTLTRLLATLSLPRALDDAADGMSISSAVVFVLEEFDLFVQHPRQMLLYNLFDIAQSGTVPISVVGLTTRFDCFESLEKRVKSRFSHMVIQVSPPSTSEEFGELFEKVLGLPDTRPYFREWNQRIKRLLGDPQSQLSRCVLYHYTHTKNLRSLYADMIAPVLALSPTEPYLKDGALSDPKTRVSDYLLDAIRGLTLLELALLISAVRYEARDVQACNFNSAYQEYKALHQRSLIDSAAAGALVHNARLWSRDVALEAWEKLIYAGLLTTVQSSAKNAGMVARECQLYSAEVDLQDLQNVLREFRKIPSYYHRWIREVI